MVANGVVVSWTDAKFAKPTKRAKLTFDRLWTLVDDYLDKHDAAVEAGNRRHTALKNCEPQDVKDAALDRLIATHNARASAFRVLRDAMRSNRE